MVAWEIESERDREGESGCNKFPCLVSMFVSLATSVWAFLKPNTNLPYSSVAWCFIGVVKETAQEHCSASVDIRPEMTSILGEGL